MGEVLQFRGKDPTDDYTNQFAERSELLAREALTRAIAGMAPDDFEMADAFVPTAFINVASDVLIEQHGAEYAVEMLEGRSRAIRYMYGLGPVGSNDQAPRSLAEQATTRGMALLEIISDDDAKLLGTLRRVWVSAIGPTPPLARVGVTGAGWLSVDDFTERLRSELEAKGFCLQVSKTA